MIYQCVSCLWLQRREYLFPLLRGDKGCVIFLYIKEYSHTPCPLSRGEEVTTGRYKHPDKSSFIVQDTARQTQGQRSGNPIIRRSPGSVTVFRGLFFVCFRPSQGYRPH